MPRHSYQVVHDELMPDGSSHQNPVTFCQTWVDEEVHRLMNKSIDKNMIDKDEYPKTAQIEARCVHMIADLWHSPDAMNNPGLLDHGLIRSRHAGRLAMKKWAWRTRSPGWARDA